MRISSHRLGTLLLLVFAGAPFVGCDQLPEEPAEEAIEVEVQASHPTLDVATATVDLRPINDSGIRGQVTIEDDGGTIVVTGGSAAGLDPSNPIPGYVSLFYDKASAPDGPEACEPGIFALEAHSDEVRRVNPHPLGEDHPLFLTGAQMAGALWVGYGPDEGDGTGEPVDLEGDYVPLDEIGTMSIRDLSVNEGFGPEAVVACGLVTHDPAN